MPSPDHAATIRRHAYHVWPAAMQLPSEQHDPVCPGCKIDTALDALVAALAQAEHERDQAIEALREIGTPTSTGSRTIQSIRRYARDVLAAIEKDTA